MHSLCPDKFCHPLNVSAVEPGKQGGCRYPGSGVGDVDIMPAFHQAPLLYLLILLEPCCCQCFSHRQPALHHANSDANQVATAMFSRWLCILRCQQQVWQVCCNTQQGEKIPRLDKG